MRVLPLLLFSVAVFAQTRLTVAQLEGFLKSSVQLQHDDGKVAAFLKKVTLTERLDDKRLEILISSGVGARTMNALRELKTASAAMPEPPKPLARAKAEPIPPPSEAEQSRALGEIRKYALDYDKRLPDFICAQVTRRFYDPAGLEFWHAADTIMAKLTYFQNKEEKKVMMVNGKFLDVEYDRLGGATSTGEFGSLLREIFADESKADFHWERWATLRGRRMHVFGYRVAQPFSKWKLVYERSLEATPGYHGLIFADRDTGQVMRVTLEAEDVPPSFPIQSASTKLDYDYAEISNQQFLLPLRAEVRMRSGRSLVKNEVEFRMYRKFGADTTITFDTPPDAIPQDQLEEKPATNKP